ncbi:MAG: RraA family protein [Thermoplasmata archaeon]|nr:MAG: RraA family protein [Thermoplasmata archaeon]
MDTIGLTKQFLPPQIKPLDDDMVVVGRALTVQETDISEPSDQPFGLMFDALDDLKPNEVYLATGMSPTYAIWGGLMSTRAIKLGAAGAILNGYHRDTPEIRSLNFPMFSWGGYAQDQGGRGEVTDYRCPLPFENGVTVHPGDIVFGDIDGVVVVPQERESEVIELAIEKIHGENKVRDAIESGMSAKDAFNKFGIF